VGLTHQVSLWIEREMRLVWLERRMLVVEFQLDEQLLVTLEVV
jgi:hypothetical protein